MAPTTTVIDAGKDLPGPQKNIYKRAEKERLCQFDVVAQRLGMIHKTIQSFSPWQNGKVERSYRVDGEWFYSRSFDNIEELRKAHRRYTGRYNNIAQRTLGFKSPNEVATEFFLTYSA